MKEILSSNWFKLSALTAVLALIVSILLVVGMAASHAMKDTSEKEGMQECVPEKREMHKESANPEKAHAMKKDAAGRAEGITKIKMHVEGMSCSGCEKNLKSALEGVSGVQTATADLKTKTAEITSEKGKAIELTQLKKAVEDNELTLKKIEVTAVGQIVSQKERLALKTNGSGQLFILLENSQLEQLEKIISQGNKEFILRGIATVYKGNSYLLISESEPVG